MDKLCTIRTCPVGDCSSHARLLPHAVNCTRFCFCRCLRLFVCVWNISGSAERICAKFTGNTCLVPLSDEFEDQGQRSKVKVTMDKNGVFGWYLGKRWKDLRHIHTENVFGLSLGRVWRSRSILATCVCRAVYVCKNIFALVFCYIKCRSRQGEGDYTPILTRRYQFCFEPPLSTASEL